MIIPWNTDAPLYHPPIATVGLIAVNTVVHLVFVTFADDSNAIEPWILQFGRGLHPLQWVTSNFLRINLMHLLSNMLFLWAFGLVVEGKLGWLRFLPHSIAIWRRGRISTGRIRTSLNPHRRRPHLSAASLDSACPGPRPRSKRQA